jgi:iron complex outermembrane receptor protein/outer membrane receptor for ferrienterochelin and colicins
MNWVGGINFNGDHFVNNSFANLSEVKNYSNSTLGLFAQNTYKPIDRLTLESGFRYDFNSKYGSFPLPRISILYKFNSNYSARINGGFGYKVPNELSFLDLESDLNNLISNSKLKAEKSQGLNADVNYEKDLDVTFNQSFFYTKITNPVFDSSSNPSFVTLENASKGLITFGFQSYTRLDYKHFELYLGYVYTNVKKEYDVINQNLVVTPKNNISGTLFFEPSENWRFGYESSYIANQLDQNYKSTKNYVLAAAMIQHNWKKFVFVLNCENLFDFRQSKYGKIYSGTIDNPVFDKLWAPIDGRVLNFSMKYSL